MMTLAALMAVKRQSASLPNITPRCHYDANQIAAASSEQWIPHDTPNPATFMQYASSSDGQKVVSATYGGNIYTSTDAGKTWTARESARNWYSVCSSADGTKLAAVADGAQIYTSTDSGVSWTARDSVRTWRRVASSSDGVNLVALGFFTTIYTSTDSGVTWTSRETSRWWSGLASSADGLKLVASVHTGFIYTSTDGGLNWAPRESARTWSPGGLTSSSDGVKLAAAVSGGFLYTSTDSGVNWTQRESSRTWFDIVSSSDGVKLIAGVSAAEDLYISINSGVTWTPQGLTAAVGWRAGISPDGTKYIAGDSPNRVFTKGSTIVNDEKVSLWRDLSGNGFDLNAQSTTVMPLYKTNRLNGLPAVTFDGFDDQLHVAAQMFPTGYQHTIFVVLNNATSQTYPGNSTVWDTGTDPWGRRTLHMINNNPSYPGYRVYLQRHIDPFPAMSFTSGEDLIIAGRFDAANSKFRLNGDVGREFTWVGSTDMTASDALFRVRARYNSAEGFSPPNGYGGGDICEIIIYNSALSDSDFAAVEAYLKTKYGIA